MSKPKLSKHQKRLVAIIEDEGGRIVGLRTGANHFKVDYTFDDRHFFTQHVPYGAPTAGSRWDKNFRAAVRKTRRQLETSP